MSLIDLIASKLFVPVYAAYKHENTFKYLPEVGAFNRLPLERIQHFQLQRIRKIAQHAYDTTRYYHNLFEKIGLKDPQQLTWDEYQQIPVLTKDIIKSEAKDLLSNLWVPEELRKTATGGTTSSPTPFYSDWDSLYRKRGATVVFDGWLGYRPGMKAAFLWQARQDMLEVKTIKEQIANLFIHRRIFLPGSPLDDTVMECYYRKLREFKPFLLQAYPTPLEIFADFLKRKAYNLTIPVVSCTAEPLLDHQKRLFMEVFGASPFNWYGAREAGRIATECFKHNGMHINCYGLYLEIAPSSYVNNDIGAILLTDLWNMGMPLIRYQIGDVGRINKDVCSCGCELPRLMEMSGRINDTFENSRGQKIPGVWFPNQFIKDSCEISSMQIIQHEIGHFEILVVVTERFGPNTEAWLQKKLDEFMLEPTRLIITKVPQIPHEKNGKLRFCKNNMKT